MGSKLYVLSLIIVLIQSIAIHPRFNVTQDLFMVEYGLQFTHMSPALKVSFRIWSSAKPSNPNVPLDI